MTWDEFKDITDKAGLSDFIEDLRLTGKGEVISVSLVFQVEHSERIFRSMRHYEPLPMLSLLSTKDATVEASQEASQARTRRARASKA